MELHKLTTQLSSSLPTATKRDQRSKLYHSSLGKTKESLTSPVSNSSSGLSQAILFLSPFTPPDSPSESTFPARLQVTEKWSSLGFTCVAKQHRALSGFHLQRNAPSLHWSCCLVQKGMERVILCTHVDFFCCHRCTDLSCGLLQTHSPGYKCWRVVEALLGVWGIMKLSGKRIWALSHLELLSPEKSV